jgi:hypothetical protein
VKVTDKYFQWVSKNSAQAIDNILSWLGSVTKIYWWQKRYKSTIITIAEATGTRWIDRAAFYTTLTILIFSAAQTVSIPTVLAIRS